MRVVLCAPPIMDRFEDTLESIAMDAHRECPPYGMYLLRAALLQAGHHVDFADLIALGTSSVRGFSAEIDRADLVGIAWPIHRSGLRPQSETGCLILGRRRATFGAV